MQITFKLYAMLAEHLPPDRQGNAVNLEVAEDSTIESVIEPFRLPEHLVHLVLVNGRYVAREHRAGHRLQAGDVLAIWPPVAGG